MRLSDVSNKLKSKGDDEPLELDGPFDVGNFKSLNNKVFSKEAEKICDIMFQEHLVHVISIAQHLTINKQERLIPFIEEGRQLFRYKCLKKLGGYL